MVHNTHHVSSLHLPISTLYKQPSIPAEKWPGAERVVQTTMHDEFIRSIHGFTNIQSNSTAKGVDSVLLSSAWVNRYKPQSPSPSSTLYHNRHIYHKECRVKGRQKVNFDHRHRTKEASEIPDHMEVWVTWALNQYGAQ